MDNDTKGKNFDGIDYKFLRKDVKHKAIRHEVEALLGKKKLAEKEEEQSRNDRAKRLP